MGLEYQLTLARGAEVESALSVCESVIAASAAWHRVPTSFADGHGVGVGDPNAEGSWPQVADLRAESPSAVFVVCHTQAGERFLKSLVAELERRGHVTTLTEC